VLCVAILWVSLVIFAVIILYVASQRVFIVVSEYFVIDSVRKLWSTPSYFTWRIGEWTSLQAEGSRIILRLASSSLYIFLAYVTPPEVLATASIVFKIVGTDLINMSGWQLLSSYDPNCLILLLQMTPTWNWPSRLWRSWTGAWISWRPSRLTAPYPIWRP
jgi:hypothetical protein